jgi:hypothetical protein
MSKGVKGEGDKGEERENIGAKLNQKVLKTDGYGLGLGGIYGGGATSALPGRFRFENH